MPLTIIRIARAKRDLAGLADYLAQQSLDLGLRFLDAADSTFQHLAETPTLGSVFESANTTLDGLQVYPVKGFPNHLIFFRVRKTQLQIVRVVHGARNLDKA